MVSSALALLLVVGVPGLWLLCALLAWVGVVRHMYRAYCQRRELAAIRREGVNGWLRWSAETNLMGERFRWLVKAGLLVFALLRFSVQWERLALLAPEWDWRDVAQPLVYLLVLLLLTHWSNWEAASRPRRAVAAVGKTPC